MRDINAAEIRALKAADLEKHIPDLGMYRSLQFMTRHGKFGMYIREHSGYDGASYTFLKSFSLVEAVNFRKNHPIVHFLCSSDQEEAESLAEQAEQENPMPNTFRGDLTALLNRYSMDSVLNIPDYILANHLLSSLDSLGQTKRLNDDWHTLEKDQSPQQPVLYVVDLADSITSGEIIADGPLQFTSPQGPGSFPIALQDRINIAEVVSSIVEEETTPRDGLLAEPRFHAVLEDWHVSVDPSLFEASFIGTIREDKKGRFPDGAEVRTSTVSLPADFFSGRVLPYYMEGELIQTRNTRYKLGRPAR